VQRHVLRYVRELPVDDRTAPLEGEVVGVGPAPEQSVAGAIGRAATVVVVSLAIFFGLLVFCVIQ
jgi:hypothetical protein